MSDSEQKPALSRKQVAAAVAALLTAVAGVLSQCPDEKPSAPRGGVTVGADAGEK